MTAQPPALTPVRRHAVFHELRVAAVERLTEDSVTITFEVPPELRDDYTFVHGQHVSLRCTVAGDDVRRNYSICSPAGSGVLRVAVKRLPEGVFSSYAHARLRPGDVIEVLTPTGRFSTPLDPTATRSYVAVAAGSGITPILSIMATTLEVERHSDVTLIYGNRTTQSIMFLEELADLKNRYPERVAIHHVLSREQQDADLLNGRIDAARMRRFLDLLVPVDAVDEWFVCGPPQMIADVREVLTERGVERAHVHAELFHAEGAAPRAAGPTPVRAAAPAGVDVSRVTVMLDGRSSTFDVRCDGERILDAALRVRGDAPYACKGGVCGTCRARVLEGGVSMDQNYALEDSEVEAGFVLACQSHPTTPAVTLDFDQ